MRLLIFCFIIIIYSCSAKRFSEDKKDDFFKEFQLVTNNSMQITTEKSFLIFNTNNKDEYFPYDSINKTYFLVEFDSDSVWIQGFYKNEEFSKIGTTIDILPNLNDSYLIELKNEKLNPFTLDNGDVVTVRNSSIDRIFCRIQNFEFFRTVNYFDIENYEEFQNINSDINLKSKSFELSSDLRFLIISYLVKINKIY
ncbi:hypothetical protein [Moheibacter stercoris]|uniref:Lipoprotein n=1 Tax=Moheibacter stercoris TaxID=1628251 RepID=A0ABV2LVX7_9FLAO